MTWICLYMILMWNGKKKKKKKKTSTEKYNLKLDEETLEKNLVFFFYILATGSILEFAY